ncbi:MAG TPA: entericidin EcnAB [Candidatus Omnitrophica bacterium]|nr:entericidin EcnAB [Candidatus Omnitrophota bacterium]
MDRFKAYFFIFFCVLISMIFSGCGTIKGIGNDISIVGEILKKV